MSAAPAGAISITRAESQTVGGSGDVDDVVLGAESVTIEADLDSDFDVEKAVAVAQSLVADVTGDHRSLLELGPQGFDSALTQLRDEVPVANRNVVHLTKKALSRLARSARAGAVNAGRAAYASSTDSHRVTLMILRTISASGAVFVGIAVSSHLPLDVQHYLSTFTRTIWTGFMSAGLVMFSDVYSDFIIKPWKAKEFIDDNAGLRRLVDSSRAFVSRGRLKARSADEPALGVKLGHYTDQFVKSLGLEFTFVYASSLSADGFTAANNSMLEVIPNLMGGGLGQMTFDQSITIIADAREARAEAKFPPGAERDAAIKKIVRWRDSRQAVNSLAQVWMVMVSKYGNEFANVALHIYAAAGVVTRVAIEIQNAKSAPKFQPPASLSPPVRALRCEFIFG